MNKAMLLFIVKLNDKHGHSRPAKFHKSYCNSHGSFYQLIMAVTFLLYKISRCVMFNTQISVCASMITFCG